MRNLTATICVALLLFACAPSDGDPPPFSGEVSEQIQLHQIGYYPGAPVRFSVSLYDAVRDSLAPAPAPEEPVYFLTTISGDSIVARGELGTEEDWTENAGARVRYTELSSPGRGEYRIYVPGIGYSYPFSVADDLHQEAFRGAVKSFYYQRASQELREVHAGKWHRPAGHPDLGARFHPSSGRTTGRLDSPGGWYDAGDYNKYVVNGAFPLGQMLALWEDVGDPAADATLNIPESGNGKSDFLDEMKVEMDWLLTMQDEDGGLFHKFTTKNFEGMVMPHEATSDRYVVGKSTHATLDFAGAAAQAARVFREYDAGYAEQCLAAARRAWAWAKANPAVSFVNPKDVSTGQYGDVDTYDEWVFAAAELFCTTGEQEFLNALQANPPKVRYNAGESWTAYMGMMGVYSLLRHEDRVPLEFREALLAEVIGVADSLVEQVAANAYRQPINTFEWGSNSDVLNAAMVMATAHNYAPKPDYLEAIRASVDYIFGHNPLGVSFLTGFGEKTPMFIHHRQSAADGIPEPVPGLLSGGPNPKQQDRQYTTYPTMARPMQSWADQEPSYASNEICLNWNAPLVYVLGWLEANQ
ncbi:glycoside hydrolase family 9 protein [Lewinella sp. W8]|uniref:glycoside hydrolase family 9 protein n=1 Tax=Lewinella sp. W8 TaxID=2528208 RepID=UPI001068B5AA|nr:glycoside hydrolase family 9 protein [Lewinella sp. W8]MTB52229.1 cellulase [Lewinella sp. W8]